MGFGIQICQRVVQVSNLGKRFKFKKTKNKKQKSKKRKAKNEKQKTRVQTVEVAYLTNHHLSMNIDHEAPGLLSSTIV